MTLRKPWLLAAIFPAVLATPSSSVHSNSVRQVRSVYGHVVKGGTLDALPAVRALITNEALGSFSTDRGLFEIKGVPSGVQQLALHHPCYLPVQVTLPAEGDVAVVIALPPDAAAERRAGCGGLKPR